MLMMQLIRQKDPAVDQMLTMGKSELSKTVNSLRRFLTQSVMTNYRLDSASLKQLTLPMLLIVCGLNV